MALLPFIMVLLFGSGLAQGDNSVCLSMCLVRTASSTSHMQIAALARACRQINYLVQTDSQRRQWAWAPHVRRLRCLFFLKTSLRFVS